MSLLPHVYASQLAGKKFDNRQPRGLVETIKNDQSIDSAVSAPLCPAAPNKPRLQE